MSWQVVVFAGLALVLAGGFWWYERSRPSARLVALVAALAALAVAGRLVLTPIPNVVATTDIALITGYALGAGPGFAVGALAAPISNIWLGQGPWTAWEMAGWGLVGLGGAWLAGVTRRRLGRLGLAVVCGLAGFAYGALLDLSVMVTYGGEQSLDRYLALSARGIPFNVAHATGNFLIALAAGPALVRMISRFRERSEFTWRPATAIPLLLVAVLAGGLAASGGPSSARAGSSSASWLERSQDSDGGYAATPGQPSSPAMTGWAMLGLEAGGTNPLDLERGGENPVSYLRGEIGRLRSVGDLERTILALDAAGVDPRRFAGHDLVSELRSRRDGDGSVDGQVNLTAFYALAMRAVGADRSSLRRSAAWLRRAQNADGGWGIQPQAPSESDSTGATLQGLVAAGDRGKSTARGVTWLRKAQRSSGGYALGGSGVVNSQSTAWAVQGLAAAGGGGKAVDRALGYLGRLRAADGHYRYSPSSDQTPIWVTAQVLLAVERAPFPLATVHRTSKPSGSKDQGGSSDGAGGGGSSAEPDSSVAPASPGGGSTPSPSTPSGGGSGGDTGGGGAPGGPDSPVSSDAGAAGSADAGATPAPPGAEPATTANAPSAADPVAVQVAYPADPDSGTDSTTYLLVGAGALALAAVAGFLWYRRRSP